MLILKRVEAESIQVWKRSRAIGQHLIAKFHVDIDANGIAIVAD